MKKNWIIWCCAVAVFSVLMVLYEISIYAPEVTLTLKQEQQAHWRVWRPFTTDKKRLSVEFKRVLSDGNLRQDMEERPSSYKNNNDTHTPRQLWLDNPGEPLRLEIGLNGYYCMMKVLPKRDCKYCRRDLIVDDGTDIPQPFGSNGEDCHFIEQPGWNEWSARVRQLSPNLPEEDIIITTNIPLSFKFEPDKNYDWLFGMHFWEFWLAVLVVWGLILMFIGLKNRKKPPLQP